GGTLPSTFNKRGIGGTLFIDGQVVGKAGSKLAIVLGLYAWMEGYFPPHKQWREQSPQSFKDVMNDIQKDYDFVDPEGMPTNLMVVTHFCKESLQKKLRDWRCWLKNHYYIEGVPNDVVVKAPDKRITQWGWELLLKFWESEKKVLEAERNKKNRGEDRLTHMLGAKSIARHNQDERLKLGDSYTTFGAYLKAHQMKSGDYPDEYTRVLYIAKTEIEAMRAREKEMEEREKVREREMEEREKAREREMKAREKAREKEMEAREEAREKEMEARKKEMQDWRERMEALLNIHLSDGRTGNSRLGIGLLPPNPPS
ncbi:hypothetical protein Taro_001831, partial [Colocasia esculenta]|nr:hypothetical protein [Colocasia esculenta]